MRTDTSRHPDLIVALSEIGVDPFFSYAGAPSPSDLKKYRGEIDYSNLWQEPAVVERTFTLAGIPGAQAKSDAAAVAAIITELRKYRTKGADQAAYENPTTPADLERDAPGIDWPRYFTLVGAPPERSINLTSKRYLPAVSRELSARSPAELRAYLRWAFLFSLRGELPAPYNQAFGDITPSLRVALDQPAKRCRDATLRGMGVEFSRQYSERILGMPARMAANQIGASIQSEIVKAVDQADWLSPAARRATAEKLRATDLKIGFPDHWPEVGSFPLSRGDFLANVLAARRYEEQRAWRRANEARSRKNWDMLVFPWVGTGMAAARLATPNAFPDQYTNSMIMTAAFLNLPRFDRHAPLAINYAGSARCSRTNSSISPKRMISGRSDSNRSSGPLPTWPRRTSGINASSIRPRPLPSRPVRMSPERPTLARTSPTLVRSGLPTMRSPPGSGRASPKPMRRA